MFYTLLDVQTTVLPREMRAVRGKRGVGKLGEHPSLQNAIRILVKT